jgi:hypothetical protein
VKEVGGYTLGAKLGEGGMGAVYRATHPRFPGREFALKVLLSDRKPATSAVERFSREMRALAVTNQHPGIVKLLGGSLEATPFLVMELVNGASLDKLTGPGGLEPKRAARIVREVADAVAYAHGQGIVHRDLKPQNIIIEEGDRPRVCDFGLARVAEEERLTRSGTFMGTPAFSAPEQLDGRAHLATERADVYGLGAVLYFALAGQQPFTGSGGEVTRRVLLERPRPPSSVREGVPRELDAICGKALEKLPIRRYPSALALRDELDRFLAGQPIETRPPGRVRLAVRALAERRGLAFVVAILLLAVLATAGGLLWTELRLRQRQNRLRELAAHLVAPGATLEELEKGLTELPKGSDELAAVELRRDEAKLGEALRAGLGAVPLAQLLDLARDARLVLEKRPDLAPVSLVGERSDLPALGLLLLDRRRLETGSVEAREKLLVAARGLASVARGPERQALSAYVELGARGAPTVALGPGRLAAATPELVAAVRQDLEAAAHLPGAAGARAAWLLADLLVLANDREARSAIERAAASAPGDVQSILEACLRDDRDPATVLAELGPSASDPKVALRLSRYLARQGLPGALEAPELAATPTRAALDAVLATDPPIAFEPRFRGPPRATKELLDRVDALRERLRLAGRFGEGDQQGQDNATRALNLGMHAAWSANGEAFEKALAEAITLDPDDDGLWDWGADENRFRLTSAVFRVSCSRREPGGIYVLAWAFSATQRAGTRIATGSNWYFPEEPWDPAGVEPGLPACRAFDERLARDAVDDPALQAFASRAPAAAEAASAAAKGLRRLEEVAEHPGLAGNERLAAEAVIAMERFFALAPAAALPYRARARRALFAGKLGEALAVLDLRRALGVLPTIVGREGRADEYAVLAANVGFEGAPPDGLDPSGELSKVAIRTIHLTAVWRALLEKHEGAGAEASRKVLDDELAKWTEHYRLHTFLSALKLRVPEDEFVAAMKPSAEDEDLVRRLSSAKDLEATLRR